MLLPDELPLLDASAETPSAMKEQVPGLTPADLLKLHRIFTQHPEIDRVLLYGSRAQGTWRDDSDIDLAVDGTIDLAGLVRLHAEIEEEGLAGAVDLILFQANHPPAFRAAMLRCAQLIYQRPLATPSTPAQPNAE